MKSVIVAALAHYSIVRK